MDNTTNPMLIKVKKTINTTAFIAEVRHSEQQGKTLYASISNGYIWFFIIPNDILYDKRKLKSLIAKYKAKRITTANVKTFVQQFNTLKSLNQPINNNN